MELIFISWISLNLTCFRGGTFPGFLQFLSQTQNNQSDFSTTCKSFLPSHSNKLFTCPYTLPVWLVRANSTNASKGQKQCSWLSHSIVTQANLQNSKCQENEFFGFSFSSAVDPTKNLWGNMCFCFFFLISLSNTDMLLSWCLTGYNTIEFPTGISQYSHFYLRSFTSPVDFIFCLWQKPFPYCFPQLFLWYRQFEYAVFCSAWLITLHFSLQTWE